MTGLLVMVALLALGGVAVVVLVVWSLPWAIWVRLAVLAALVAAGAWAVTRRGTPANVRWWSR